MARVLIYVQKSRTWRGVTQTFGNTYRVGNGGLTNDVADLNTLCDTIVAAEKNIHANDVTFHHVRAWEDNSLAPNYMLISRPISGVGAQTPSMPMFKEAAIMLHALLPYSYTGGRRYTRLMRKFYRTGFVHGYDTSGVNATSQPSAGTPLANFLQSLNNNFGSAGYTLRGPDGAERIANWTAHPYLETREFGR